MAKKGPRRWPVSNGHPGLFMAVLTLEGAYLGI